MTIPRKAKPGYHTVELEGRKSRLKLSARIKVLRAKYEQGYGGAGQSSWSYRSNGSDHRDGQGGPGPHNFVGRGNSQHPPALDATGGRQALAVGGIAAGLFAAGGGTRLAVRRRRSS
ncbi:hypothetical protein AB0M68_32435 [Streptomyces sp. NPDC051453]|uniref:hypothetical protein n=1 Tax=Streptomyces sp. NPDC051453 TaxID=3154941 RepID=UPI00343C769F